MWKKTIAAGFARRDSWVDLDTGFREIGARSFPPSGVKGLMIGLTDAKRFREEIQGEGGND